MNKIKTVLPKAILAGMFINIAATIYLSIPNKIIGSLMFTFGLFAVLVTQSNLYTGMAGYFPNRSALEIIIAFVGNTIGCLIYSLSYSFTASSANVQPLAYTLCENKFANSSISILISSIFCGALTFIAVDTFKKNKDIIGVVVVILCVSGFILAGFEHSIANISYIALAKYPISLGVCFKVMLMAIGNFIGAVIVRKLAKS
jgi:formate/nitrite transporter FocA (FNT family)